MEGSGGKRREIGAKVGFCGDMAGYTACGARSGAGRAAGGGFLAGVGQRNLVAANPCDGVRPPKSPRRLPKALSVDEASALLAPDGEDDPLLALRDSAIFELFYSSGLRLAELAALDVDVLEGVLAEGEVRVLGKRNKARIVPVGAKARKAHIAAVLESAAKEIRPAGDRVYLVGGSWRVIARLDMERRLRDLEHLSTLEPENLDNRLLLAYIYYFDGRYLDAAGLMEEIVKGPEEYHVAAPLLKLARIQS